MFGFGVFQRALWAIRKKTALLLAVSLIATLVAAAPRAASAADIATTNWWPGDGNADDVAGSQTGSLGNGTTFGPGKAGRAFSFDGLDDHVNFGTVAGNVGTSDFTLAFWIKTSSSGSYRGIIGKRPACGHGSMFDVRLTPTGRILVELDYWGTNYNVFAGNLAVNDGAFHHVGLVRKGATASLYVDGRLDVTKSTPGITNIANNTSLVAGLSRCTGFDGTGYFKGLLDEIVIGPDQDADGRPNAVDNCRDVVNGMQEDADGDGVGDACDQAPPFLTNLAPADGASFATSTPTLSATFDDPNLGDDGYVEFEVYKDVTLVASNVTGAPVLVQPGQTATWQIPEGNLNSGGTYTWRARAVDGTHLSDWTSSRAFSIGGASVNLRQWSSDSSTGRVDYEFSATASGLNAGGDVAGPCFQIQCSWRVETRHADGSVEKGYGVLASGTLAADTGSLQEPVVGTHWMEITHIKTIVEPSPCYGCVQTRSTYDSGWIKVGDPYPDGNVSLKVNLWKRDADSGVITYDLGVSAWGASQVRSPCEEKGCQWKVEARHDDGATTDIGSGQLPGGTWAFTRSVTGTTATAASRVTHLRATLASMCRVNMEYWCWEPPETYTTKWIFVGDLMVGGIDLVPYAAALAGTYALNKSKFCEPLLLKPYPNTNGNSLNDVFESCEAMVLAGVSLSTLLAELAEQAPDTVDELLEFWEKNPAPSEEDRNTPLAPYPGEGEPDPGCEPEIWGHDDPLTITHIESRHTWRAGAGASEFYRWVSWRWLVDYAESAVWPTPSGSKCQRVVRYEPAPVGVIRYHRFRDSPLAGEPTRWYTVVTERDGKLVTAYPGMSDE